MLAFHIMALFGVLATLLPAQFLVKAPGKAQRWPECLGSYHSVGLETRREVLASVGPVAASVVTRGVD